jgi:hypothetical protein
MATLTAYIEFDEQTGLYVGIVPAFPARTHPGGQLGRAARQSS